MAHLRLDNIGVYFWLCRCLLDIFLRVESTFFFNFIIQWLPIVINTQIHSVIVDMLLFVNNQCTGEGGGILCKFCMPN